jgi:hypothetical protein
MSAMSVADAAEPDVGDPVAAKFKVADARLESCWNQLYMFWEVLFEPS